MHVIDILEQCAEAAGHGAGSARRERPGRGVLHAVWPGPRGAAIRRRGASTVSTGAGCSLPPAVATTPPHPFCGHPSGWPFLSWSSMFAYCVSKIQATDERTELPLVPSKGIQTFHETHLACLNQHLKTVGQSDILVTFEETTEMERVLPPQLRFSPLPLCPHNRKFSTRSTL